MIGKKKKLTIFIVLMIILTFGKGIKGKNSQVDVTPENTEIIKSKSKNGRYENTEEDEERKQKDSDNRRNIEKGSKSRKNRSSEQEDVNHNNNNENGQNTDINNSNNLTRNENKENYYEKLNQKDYQKKEKDKKEKDKIVSVEVKVEVVKAKLEQITINRVINTDNNVTGTARTNANISIVIGSTEYTGKANSEGRYSIPVNDPHEGTIVAGRQSMYDKISSDIVTTIVGMAKGEKPTINEVKSNHTFVTGKGLVGSRIKILLEDGQIYTADVDTNGDYRVVIPAQQTGKKIIATQLTPRRMESDGVETIVVRAMPAPKPTINEVDTDDTKVTGKGVPNSRVYVKIPGKLERYVSVNVNGDWEVDTGLLEAGKEIIAYQELPDRPNSEEVKRTVVQLPALRDT